MNRERITVATNIRFWQASSGAEARIAQLVGHLDDVGFDVEVYFVGDARGVPQEFEGRIAIVQADQLAKKVTGLKRLAVRARGMLSSATAAVRGGRATSGSGGDWRGRVSDIEQAAFADYLRGRNPRALFVEYIWLTRLVTGLPGDLRRKVRCFVDTHDVMHLRTEQFETRKRQVHMPIDAAGEREALECYDVVVAIQHEDAAVFRSLCPAKTVIVAGHAGAVTPLPGPQKKGTTQFLFVGSRSHPNVDSLKGLLAEVWLALQARHGDGIRLSVVGNIAERRDELPDAPNVTYHGIVADLAEVYAEADVVLAPVLYGTGLKIKVVEALCYGKATVTMPAGVDGMIIHGDPPCAILQDWPQYLATCEGLIEAPEEVRSLEAAATDFARKTFSENEVFASLVDAIGSRQAGAKQQA